MIILEVIADVSFDWASIVESIWVANKDNKWFIIYGTNITWSFIHQYPACQVVNLNDYIDFSRNVPSNVEFYFNDVPNLGVSLQVEDGRRSLTKRPLISNSNDCTKVSRNIYNRKYNQV